MTRSGADYMDELYACLKCNTTFKFGTAKCYNHSAQYPFGLACPTCNSGQGLHPADGDCVTLPEYFGEIGTLQ